MTPREPYRASVDAYLAGLDRALPPEAVAGVYLLGSVALGDYHHGSSDLDLLTLTTRPLSEPEMSALAALHEKLETGAQPHADAWYVPSAFLGKLPPDDAPGRCQVTDGQFSRGPGGQELVMWATLSQCGITLRGPEAAALGAAPDAAEFRAWNRGNLEAYWRRQARELRPLLDGRDADAEFSSYGAVWFGTGPGRLHRTIACGDIISKGQSADYTAELFPAHADLLLRVKASRAGDESIRYTTRDGLALFDLVDEICDSAAALS